MKLNIKQIGTGALSVILAGFLMQGCSASNPDGNAEDTVQAPVLSVAALTVSGVVLDATTLKPVEGASIAYSGNGKDDIVNKSSQSAPGGVVTFTSNKTTTSVNVLASKDGYIDTGVQVSVVDSNSSTFTIKMIKVDNTPTGVAAKQEEVNATINNDGNITAPIVIETVIPDANASAKTQKTELVIPAGTVIKDKSGAVVDGNLSVTLTAFTADDENSTQSFPGGFAVLAQTSEPNATTSVEENISFVTAGFTSIVIKNDKGQKVKEFSQPIEVKMQIKEGTINPDTNKAIAVNDIVPVWSFEEDTGVWSFEQNGTVKDLNTTDGFYDVVVQANHLSYWNLDWHYSAVCNQAVIDLKDSNGNLVVGKNVYMHAKFQNGSGYLFSGYIYGDGFAKMYNVPKNKPIIVDAYLSVDRTKSIGTLTMNVTDAACTAGTHYTLPVDTTAFPVIVEQKVKVQEMCANGKINRTAVPNLYMYATDTSNGYQYLGGKYTDVNGEVSYNVVKNDTINYYIAVGSSSAWEQTGSYYDSITTSGAAETLTYTLHLVGNTANCLANEEQPEDTGATGGTTPEGEEFQ